jgi:CRISPR-associated endonuclease/helicase Cas3
MNVFKSYSQKEIKKSQLNALMQFFSFTLLKFYDAQRPYVGEEMYGYYFVESYDDFITDEYKFDRQKYNELKNSNFL